MDLCVSVKADSDMKKRWRWSKRLLPYALPWHKRKCLMTWQEVLIWVLEHVCVRFTDQQPSDRVWGPSFPVSSWSDLPASARIPPSSTITQLWKRKWEEERGTGRDSGPSLVFKRGRLLGEHCFSWSHCSYSFCVFVKNSLVSTSPWHFTVFV